MLVTTKLLKKIKACQDQVDLFKKLYPQGIDIPKDPAEAQRIYDKVCKGGLNIEWWLIKMKLTGIARWWYPDGKPEGEAHYRNGTLQDLKDGTAAERWWHPDGKLKYEYHYRNGILQDLKDGTAAVKYFHPDGKLRREYHYKNGALHDPEDGTAAERWWYPNGEPKCETHYQNGVK